MFRLMRSYVFDLGGSRRTMWDLFEGFSLMMSLQSAALGVVGWLVTPDRRMAALFTVASAGFAAVSIVYFFVAPTSFLVVATLLFGAALVRG